jgi:hypothetical protein
MGYAALESKALYGMLVNMSHSVFNIIREKKKREI